MGIYLQAVNSPDIDSPDYVGTYGSSQSNVILTLVQYYQTLVAGNFELYQLDDWQRNEFSALSNEIETVLKAASLQHPDDGRIYHDIRWFKIIDAQASKDAYEFRKFAIDRGARHWLQVIKYDDDHVKNVRDVIAKIAANGQDVYET